MWRAVCGMMGAECFVSAAVLYVCRARCGLHREAWRPVLLQLCVCMLWAYVDGRGKAQGGDARDYSWLASVSHLSASSRQPRMGGHAMGAHFNVAMRAMKHIQLYTYHVHALSKCVLARNGRFRW